MAVPGNPGPGMGGGRPLVKRKASDFVDPEPGDENPPSPPAFVASSPAYDGVPPPYDSADDQARLFHEEVAALQAGKKWKDVDKIKFWPSTLYDLRVVYHREDTTLFVRLSSERHGVALAGSSKIMVHAQAPTLDSLHELVRSRYWNGEGMSIWWALKSMSHLETLRYGEFRFERDPVRIAAHAAERDAEIARIESEARIRRARLDHDEKMQRQAIDAPPREPGREVAAAPAPVAVAAPQDDRLAAILAQMVRAQEASAKTTERLLEHALSAAQVQPAAPAQPPVDLGKIEEAIETRIANRYLERENATLRELAKAPPLAPPAPSPAELARIAELEARNQELERERRESELARARSEAAASEATLSAKIKALEEKLSEQPAARKLSFEEQLQKLIEEGDALKAQKAKLRALGGASEDEGEDKASNTLVASYIDFGGGYKVPVDPRTQEEASLLTQAIVNSDKLVEVGSSVIELASTGAEKIGGWLERMEAKSEAREEAKRKNNPDALTKATLEASENARVASLRAAETVARERREANRRIAEAEARASEAERFAEEMRRRQAAPASPPPIVNGANGVEHQEAAPAPRFVDFD